MVIMMICGNLLRNRQCNYGYVIGQIKKLAALIVPVENSTIPRKTGILAGKTEFKKMRIEKYPHRFKKDTPAHIPGPKLHRIPL